MSKEIKDRVLKYKERIEEYHKEGKELVKDGDRVMNEQLEISFIAINKQLDDILKMSGDISSIEPIMVIIERYMDENDEHLAELRAIVIEEATRRL